MEEKKDLNAGCPYSQERLSLLPDGRVRYMLRRPWPTPAGVSELVLDPVKFLRRLYAPIPHPYVNFVRYHSIFSNRSLDRAHLLPIDPPRAPARLSLQEQMEMNGAGSR